MGNDFSREMAELGWRFAQLEADHQRLEAKIKKAFGGSGLRWMWAVDFKHNEAHLFLFNRDRTSPFGFAAICGGAAGTIGGVDYRWSVAEGTPPGADLCVTCLEGLVSLSR